MERVIRVAQIIGFAAEGGVESMIYHLYEQMDKSKIVFDFFVNEGSDSKIISEDNVKRNGGRIIYIPSIKKLLINSSKLVELLKQGNYDIVHANKSTLNYFYLKAAKKAGIPIRISHSHSTSSKKEWEKDLAKNMLRPLSKKYATHFFACSEYAGRYLFGDKCFEEGKVTVINNAVNIDEFKYDESYRTQIRKEYGITDFDIVLGHIGRFQPQKNQEFLIHVFSEFHKRNPQSKLLIIGDGPLKNSLENEVQQLGLKESVIFAGTQSEPWKFYNAMDCFVLPSLYEGLPVVGVEAQVNGLPCFFANTITKEILLREESYFISLNESAKKWSDFISEKLKKQKGNSRMVAYQRFYGSKFDLNNEANRLTIQYENIVNPGLNCLAVKN